MKKYIVLLLVFSTNIFADGLDRRIEAIENLLEIQEKLILAINERIDESVRREKINFDALRRIDEANNKFCVDSVNLAWERIAQSENQIQTLRKLYEVGSKQTDLVIDAMEKLHPAE